MTESSTDWYEAGSQQGESFGVLYLHSMWGLTRCDRRRCDALADIGFLVVAPDLYEGAVAHTWEEAQSLRCRRRAADRWTTIARATAHLRRQAGYVNPIGIIGFSMGGHWALFLAQRRDLPVAATIAYYGVRGGDYRLSRSAFQLHLAEHDDFVTSAKVARLRTRLDVAGRAAEFYTYPGTFHAFCEEENPEAYDAPAAALAWSRTQSFVAHHLVAAASGVAS